MWITDLPEMHQCYGTQVTVRGGCAQEGQGQGKKPNTLMWLMCSLYRNECRNLKLAGTTMGRGLRRSEERSGRDEPIEVVIYRCKETTQGNSLCSYLFLKLAKMARFSSSLLFLFLQNQRTRGWNRFCCWAWHQWEEHHGEKG
jgi:hypothetical protein